MTPEPSNEYQKLVEAGKAALDSELCRQSLVQGTKYVADAETGLRDANMYIALDELAHAALSALKLPHAGDDGWQDIATAPYRTPVEVRAGHMIFQAVLAPDAAMTTEEKSCDQWQAVHEGEHPPCWTDGACWESNEDGNASLQPVAWRPLPTPPAKGTPHV